MVPVRSIPDDDDKVLDRVRVLLRAADPSHQDVASSDVVWLGRNDQRIDVRLRDPAGREHHVVAMDDGTALTLSLVLNEPDQVPAHPPLVVVVNGPSSSGKSTLMAAIARHSHIPWVRFDEPIVGTTDQRVLVWRERAPHVHAGFLGGIAAVAAAGNAVAVSAGGHPQSSYRRSLAGLTALYVGLDCPMEVLLAWERGREGRWGGLAVQSINDHDGWSYDLRIDTSTTDPDHAALAVLALPPDE